MKTKRLYFRLTKWLTWCLLCLVPSLTTHAQTCSGVVLNIATTTHSTSGTTGSWMVPTGGPYKVRLTAKGAKGGSGRFGGGQGATIVGEYVVFSGQVIEAVAGAIGGTGVESMDGGGGGGGSGFRIRNGALLMVAGGGGGGGFSASGQGGQGVRTGASVGGGEGGYISGVNADGQSTFEGLGGTGSSSVGGGGVGGGGGGDPVSVSPSPGGGGGGGGGYGGGSGSGDDGSGGGGGGSLNLGTSQSNTGGNNNGGGQVIIECLGTPTLSATATPTSPACSTPTQGSVSIDLTGDLNGNTSGGVEYAIVSGNSFTGTPTFADITADPLNLTSGTGTMVGTYTVRVRLKYNPTLYVDRTYAISPPTLTPVTIYVKANATGGNNGTSWTDAFTSLQDALAAACSGAQIWVAAGTYYPTTSLTNRKAAFVMKDGVAIYGGFPSTGNPTMADRNWTTNPTILSGDINQNDGANFANNSGNSYHVILNDGNGLDDSAILDGFTITGANANGGSTSSGGGMYNVRSSPNVVNCSFSGNQAEIGGGMYNLSSSPNVVNCSFSGNQAEIGGGMYNVRSSPSVVNCSFSGNQATLDGGGMYNALSSPSVVNCSFSGNQATLNGGGMFNARSSPSLVNCSFSGNSAGRGGGMFNVRSSPSFKNCILWGNSSEVFNDGIDSNPTYTNILLQGLAVGGFQGTENPLFVQQPPVGLGTTGNLRLQACSPALNAGNSADNTTTTDLAGNPRFFNNSTVDLGAYEYQGSPVAQPTASASTTTPSVCTGLTINLSASGGQIYSWSGPSGSNYGSSVQNPSFTGSTTAFGGVYTVSVSNANCALTATNTVSVQVNAPPSDPPSSNSPVCVGGTLKLSVSSGTAWTWSGPNGFSNSTQTPSRSNVTTAMSGVYSVTLSTANGCRQVATTQVAIGQVNTPQLSSNSPLCVGTTLRLSVTGAGAGATYSWGASSVFSSTLQNPTRPNASPTISGTYSVTVNGACSSTVLTTTVAVSPNVAPSITSLQVNNLSPNAQNNTVAICNNAAVSLNIAATNAVTYSWRGPTGAGSGFTSSLVSPVSFQIATPRQGQYTVTVRNGCTVFNQRVINIQLINCNNTRLASAEETEPVEMEINAYPNPVSKTLTVEVRLQEAKPLQLRLVNSVRQPSGEWNLSEPSTYHRTELNLSDLTGGVYLLEAQAGKQRAVKRVVKVQYE